MAKTVKVWDGTQWQDIATAIAQPDVSQFATAAQGALADSAVQPGDLATVATTGAYADLTGAPTSTRWAVRLPGVVGNNLSTPNPIDYTALTELDVRWVGTLDSALPLAATLSLVEIGLTSPGRSLAFQYLGGSDSIALYLSGDGANWQSFSWASVSSTLTQGSVVGLRAVWRADDGSGAPDARIFSSADEGATWTQQAISTSVPASLFATAQNVVVANNSLSASSVMSTSIRRNGTTVAEYDATAGVVQRYTDDYDNVWTISGSAWSGKKGL